MKKNSNKYAGMNSMLYANTFLLIERNDEFHFASSLLFPSFAIFVCGEIYCPYGDEVIIE